MSAEAVVDEMSEADGGVAQADCSFESRSRGTPRTVQRVILCNPPDAAQNALVARLVHRASWMLSL